MPAPDPLARVGRRTASPPTLAEQGALLAVVVLGLSGWLLGQLGVRGDGESAGLACRWPRTLQAERDFTRVVTCAPVPGGGRPLQGPARWLFGQRLSLNEADTRLLEALPGIGPARASAIVAERRVRSFDSVGDLSRVHGIGPATTRALAPFLRVDPAPVLESGSAEADGAD